MTKILVLIIYRPNHFDPRTNLKSKQTGIYFAKNQEKKTRFTLWTI